MLTGPTGSGKTTLLSQLSLDLCAQVCAVLPAAACSLHPLPFCVCAWCVHVYKVGGAVLRDVSGSADAVGQLRG